MSMFSITSSSEAPRARRGALERVQVHAHQVDELDPVLLGGAHVLRVVAHRQQARVQLRVQRLDAAVHDLRKAGEVGDRAHLDARVGQLAGGAAGGDDLDPQLRQAAGELDDPRLVGDRQQRAPDLRPDLPHGRRGGGHGIDVGVHDERLYRAITTRRGLPGSKLTAPRASRPTASTSSSCSTGRRRSSTSAGSGVGQLDGALEDHRSGVDAAVDEVHGDAEHLDPVVDGLLDRLQPRERRQQRRVHVDDRVRERCQELRAEQLHVAGEHHQLDAALAQPGGDRGVAGGPVGEADAGECLGRDPRLPGARERPRVRLVGGDRDQLHAVTAVRPVDQRLKVGAGARGQDADVHAARSLGKRPPVERSRPASSSSSTRPSTSSERRCAKDP